MAFKISKDRLPVIITPAGADEPLRFAATELARYLGLVLGKTVDLAESPGNSQSVIRLEVVPDRAGLTDEGYEVTVTGGEMRLAAGGPAGVVYGVYEILRRYTGCCFSGLAPHGEYVPRHAALEIPEGQWRCVPKLWYRGLQFSFLTDLQLMTGRLDWMAKNGMNYVMTMMKREDAGTHVSIDPQTGEERRTQTRADGPPYGNSRCMTLRWFRENMLPEMRKRGLKWDMNHHNLFYWLPPEKYMQAHPNWFALQNGKRVAQARQLAICTSNDQAVAELVANVLAFIRSNPEVDILGVIPEDGGGHCKCEQCLRMDLECRYDDKSRTQPPCSIEFPSKARRYALLVNAVARAVKKEFPGVHVGALAYTDLLWPSRDVVLEDNVVQQVALYWRCGAHPLAAEETCIRNRGFHDVLRQWKAAHSGPVIAYEYYMGMYSQWGLPYPMGDVICRDWQELKRLGLDGATIQSTDMDHNVYALNYMALARHGWEDMPDYNALRAEFVRGIFGAAADTLMPVYREFDEQAHCIERNQGESPPLPPVNPVRGCMLPDGKTILHLGSRMGFDSIREKITAALSAADATQKIQLQHFEQAVQYWRVMADIVAVEQAVSRAEASNNMVEARRIIVETLSEYRDMVRTMEAWPQFTGWVRDPSVWLNRMLDVLEKRYEEHKR